MLGGVGTFAPPAPDGVSPYTLNSAPDGAINPWQTPAAYSHGGTTLFPWVDRTGNIEIGVFNETTKLVTARYTIFSSFQVDAHSSPTLWRRTSDGTIIAAASRHNSSVFQIKTSSSPDNPSSWSGATALDSMLGGTRYSDSQLYEDDGDLYLFYRDEPSAGTDSRWCISTTSASTPTSGWAAQTIVFRINSTRSYVISAIDTANRKLHFIATNGGATVGGIAGFSRLGHFYLNLATGTYHKTDGTTISLPLNFSSITQIYSGTNTVFASNVVIDSSGFPVVAAQDKIAGAIRYIYIRYNGSTWNATNVVGAGTGYEYSGPGTGFASWGSCIRDSDPDIMFAIRDTGGNPEVYSYDAGAAFAETQLTSGSTSPYQQMICVRSDDPTLQAMCQQGSWTSYTNYSVGLIGFGE